MNVTPIPILLLLAAAAIPIAAPTMPATGAVPAKVCVLTGAGMGCEAPRTVARVVRPLDL
jgi:hypothetical protein